MSVIVSSFGDSGDLVPMNPYGMPPAGPPAMMLIGELSRLFLEEYRLRVRTGAVTAGRFEEYRRTITELARQYGHLPIDGLRGSDVTKFILNDERLKSPHTQAGCLRTVSRLFNWAEENGLGRRTFRMPRGLIATPQPREACKPEEFHAIMDVARGMRGMFLNGRRERWGRSQFRLAMFALWETGCRTCELKAMLWENLDWEAGVIRLAESKTSRATGQCRIIALSDRLLRVLRWVRRHRVETDGAQGHIFLNSRGRPWEKSMLNARFRQYRELAGITRNISPYSLRHGYCARALEDGIGERQVADVMGHTTTKYVSWYGRSTRNNTNYLRATVERTSGQKPTGERLERDVAHKLRSREQITAALGPKLRRAGKASPEEVAARVAVARELFAKGATYLEVCKKLAETYGISVRTAEKCISLAQQQTREQGGK